MTFLKLGLLHCLSVFLYSSLLGFSIRCYGERILLWLCSIISTLPPLPPQIRQGSIYTLLEAANSYNPEPFSELFQRHLFQNHSAFTKLARIITKIFRGHLRRQLFVQAREFLLHRLSQVPWHLSTSPHLFDTLHRTPTKIIPSFSRLAILRWSIGSEPDAHFRLRRFISRRSSCRCGCRIVSALYPYGLAQGSVAATHLSASATWRSNLQDPLPPPNQHLTNHPTHLSPQSPLLAGHPVRGIAYPPLTSFRPPH